MIVVARLKGKPLLAGQVIAALMFAALAREQAWPVRGDGAGAMIRALLFGDAVATALMIAAAFTFWTCLRLWSQRESYVFH